MREIHNKYSSLLFLKTSLTLAITSLTALLLLSGCQGTPKRSIPAVTNPPIVTQPAKTPKPIPPINTPTPIIPPVITEPSPTPPIVVPPSNENIKVTDNSPFTLNLNQTAELNPPGTSIRFDAVKSDSRCPNGARCVWAGEATVQITVAGFSTDPNSLQISSSDDELSIGEIDGVNYSLKFIDLTPYPGLESKSKSTPTQAVFQIITPKL